MKKKRAKKVAQYNIKEIDYLQYNTIFSIQQLLSTLNKLAAQQAETVRLLWDIEKRVPPHKVAKRKVSKK